MGRIRSVLTTKMERFPLRKRLLTDFLLSRSLDCPKVLENDSGNPEAGGTAFDGSRSYADRETWLIIFGRNL